MTRDNLRTNEISYTTIGQYLYPPPNWNPGYAPAYKWQQLSNLIAFWNMYAKLCSDSVLRLGGGARQLTWSMLVIVNLQKLRRVP